MSVPLHESPQLSGATRTHDLVAPTPSPPPLVITSPKSSNLTDASPSLNGSVSVSSVSSNGGGSTPHSAHLLQLQRQRQAITVNPFGIIITHESPSAEYSSDDGRMRQMPPLSAPSALITLPTPAPPPAATSNSTTMQTAASAPDLTANDRSVTPQSDCSTIQTASATGSLSASPPQLSSTLDRSPLLMSTSTGIQPTARAAPGRRAGYATLPTPNAAVGLSPHFHTARHAHLLPVGANGTNATNPTNSMNGKSGQILSKTPTALSVSSASPPLVPRARVGQAPSPPLNTRSVSAAPSITSSSSSPFNSFLPVLPLARVQSSDSSPRSARSSRSHIGRISQSQSQTNSRQPSRHGSRSGSRPNSRNTGGVCHPPCVKLPSTSSSRPTSRPGSTHGSRAGSRRGSLEGHCFVAGGDMMSVEQLRMKRHERRARSGSDADDAGGDEEEESNTSLPADSDREEMGDSSERMAIDSDEDGETETLETLRAIPPRRLNVSTIDESPRHVNGNTNSSYMPPFRIPTLTLPTPTSAQSIHTPATGSASASASITGSLPRARFLDLKLVCPSPDRDRSPPMTKEDKLLFFSRQCSILTDSLCVSSRLIAQDWNQFILHGLTHVVNCAGDICENYFEDFRMEDATLESPHDSEANAIHHNGTQVHAFRQTRPIKYLRLFLLDSQDEDLMCVLYPVIEFIESARAEAAIQLSPTELAAKVTLNMAAAATTATNKENDGANDAAEATSTQTQAPTIASTINSRVLIHCQQGVSRSTALCIAYLMLEGNRDYESAYSLVRSIRGICRPNFGFIAQLTCWRHRLEGWIDGRSQPMLYRVAPHCSRDRRIVVKIVDKINAEMIDSRTIFIYVTRDYILIWIGSLVLPKQEQCYMVQVRKHIERLRKYEHAPMLEFVIRQTSEQQFARDAFDSRKECVYELRDPSIVPSPSLLHSTPSPSTFERSPSQQLFLATLMSPTTLQSLNLQPHLARGGVTPTPTQNGNNANSASVSPAHLSDGKNSARSVTSLTSLASPLKPPTHPNSSTSPHALAHTQTTPTHSRRPSTQHTPRQAGNISPATSISTPMQISVESSPEHSLTWLDVSRAFWSMLNGSPVTDLLCADYDESYPSHEWMALHLASQGAKGAHATGVTGVSTLKRHRSTDPPLITGLTSHSSSASVGGSVAANRSRRGSRDAQRMRRRSSASSAAAALAASVAAASASASATVHEELSIAGGASNVPINEFRSRLEWLRARWFGSNDELETAIITPILATPITTLAAAIIADNITFYQTRSPSKDRNDHSMLHLKQAALCGSQRIVESILAAHHLTYLYDDSCLLSYAAASNNLPFMLHVAFEVARGGGRMREDLYRLAQSFHITDQIMDVFHQHAPITPVQEDERNSMDTQPPPEVPNDPCPSADDLDVSMTSVSSRSDPKFESSFTANLSPPALNLPMPPHHRHQRSHAYDGDEDSDQGSTIEELSPSQTVENRLSLSARLQSGDMMEDDADMEPDDDDAYDVDLLPAAGAAAGVVSDQLNPLLIGLGDPVPIGFVANSVSFAHTFDDTSSSEDEMAAGGGGRARFGGANNAIANPNSVATETTIDPPHASDMYARNGGRNRERNGHHPTNVASDDAEDACVDVASVSVDDGDGDGVDSCHPSWKLVPRLFAYPDFEELTSFDYDDLLPHLTLLLELRSVRRRGGTNDDESRSNSDDDDDGEVPEVRNLRLRQNGDAKPKLSSSRISTRPAKIDPFVEFEPTPPPPTYHVWFGKTANHRPDSTDIERLARNIVRQFRQQQNANVNETSAPMSCQNTIESEPNVRIEFDGSESDEFNAAFEFDEY